MGCLKGHFDFTLDYYDCDKLTFKDQSIWTNNEKQEYTLNITTPLDVSVSVDIHPEVSNIITAEEMKMSCLIDGIYKFSVTNCGSVYTKHKAVLCQAECGINKLTAKHDSEKDLKIIKKLRFYVEAIRINAEQRRPNQAKKYFEFLKDELRRLHCECSC